MANLNELLQDYVNKSYDELLAFGKIDSGKDNRTKVEGITAEDLQEVARSVFDISKLSKLIYI